MLPSSLLIKKSVHHRDTESQRNQKSKLCCVTLCLCGEKASVLFFFQFGVQIVRVHLARVEPAHVWQPALDPATGCNQFGSDSHCDFLGSDSADIESDRCVHALKYIL